MTIENQNLTTPTVRPENDLGQVRVLVVDDSAVVRGLITRMLEAETDIKVVQSAANGELALRVLERVSVDVVVLDIEMPVMDGLTALPKILAIDRHIRVLMASTLTLRNAEISLRALQAGAADYVPKPSSARDISAGEEFRRELVTKVRGLGGERRRRARRVEVPVVDRDVAVVPKAAKIGLRNASGFRPEVLAVGSSTGGPQALLDFFKKLPMKLGMPVVVTQHMPATFTAVLASHIAKSTNWPCSEAVDGETLQRDQIYIAPGNYHLELERKGAQLVSRLTQSPPENFCRPAVDPMFRSVARTCGSRSLGLVLTGMGADGLKGGQAIVEAGGTILAQDEASSVVWGMPGAVATAGICSAVLPLPELAPHVFQYVEARAR